MAVRDVLLAAVIIFTIGTGFFILHYIMDTTVDNLITQKTINESEEAKSVFQSITTNLTNRLDYIVLGLFIGLVLAILVTGWLIGGYPIFMFIYFIILIIGAVISTIMANVWEDVTAVSAFGTTITSFTFTNHIISNLPMYIVIIGFLGLVVMFSKTYMVSNG